MPMVILWVVVFSSHVLAFVFKSVSLFLVHSTGEQVLEAAAYTSLIGPNTQPCTNPLCEPATRGQSHTHL